MRRIAITAGVAAGFLGIALASGGYPSEAVGALTVLVWWTVIVGLFAGNWRHRAVPRAAVVAIAALGGLAALSFLSMAWAFDGGAAFVAGDRALLYTGVLTLAVLAIGPEDVRPCLGGLAIGSVLIAAVALASRFEPAFPGGDSQLAALLPSARGRLAFPIDYWNGLAACLALGVVALAWFGSEGRGRLVRAAAAAGIPPLAIAIYYTSSRGGAAAGGVGLMALIAMADSRARLLVGTALGLLAGGGLIALARTGPELLRGASTHLAAVQGDQMLAATLGVALATGAARYALDPRLAGLRVGRTAARVAIGTAALVAVVAVIAANPAKRVDELTARPAPPPAPSQFVATHLLSGSGSGRWQFWGAALDGFAAEPVHGIGAGGWASYWNEFRTISSPAQNAHSLFLETLAELGVAGLALLLVFLGSPLVAVRRGAQSGGRARLAGLVALLATALVSAAIDWTWQIPAAFAPAVMVIGILVGGAGRGSQGGERYSGSSARRRVALVAVCAVALAALWAGGSLFLAQLDISRSRGAVGAGEVAAALRDANDAISVQGFAAEGWLQRGLVEEVQGRIPAARADVDAAIVRAPNDWRLYLVAARLAIRAEDITGAQADLAAARSLNPLAAPFE